MEAKDLAKLKLWEGGHLTSLALSCLDDEEIPDPQAFTMREHLTTCGPCRKKMAEYMRVDLFFNGNGEK